MEFGTGSKAVTAGRDLSPHFVRVRASDNNISDPPSFLLQALQIHPPGFILLQILRAVSWE